MTIHLKQFKNKTMGTYFSVFLILFGIFGVIGMIIKIQGDARKEILNELFKKNEITAETYKKYLDN